MKKTLILIIALLFTSAAYSRPVAVDASVELNAAYVWRGMKVCGLNAAPSLSLTSGAVTFQSYGYLALDNSYKEIDLDLSYKYRDFSFHVADYFYQGTAIPYPENYFDFSKAGTTHISEAIICYDCPYIPLNAKWFTFFFGDWLPQSDGTRGDPTFSSYFELEAYHDFMNGGRLSAFAGLSILKGQYTDYQSDFAFVHLECRYTRTLLLESIHIPLTFSYVLNPWSGASYMNAGFGLRF